ncbi:hypothetical protein ABW20_dc0104216 [Dactylellina cionopaga]|nr:hypothetical protein ABW20_dc0104216 [Dactylellina cionopaga]
MSKFKKFASKCGRATLDLIECVADAVEQSQAESAKRVAAAREQAAATATRAPVSAAAATTPKKPTVEINPVEWVSHCNHTTRICDACITRIKTCIQYAVDNGVPGGFNFATGQLDRDVAECNNSCPHKLINDCCAQCMLNWMPLKMAQVNNLISISNAAVGHLTNAATGVRTAGSGISTLRQNVTQQSLDNQARRDEVLRQQMLAPVQFGFGGGYWGGGGTWDRQQQIANGFSDNNVSYTVNSPYGQTRY